MNNLLPSQEASVVFGEDIERFLNNFRVPSYKEIRLSRWYNDWGMGEGETIAFVRRDEEWGVDLTIMTRHSKNNPVGGSPSIMEIVSYYMDIEDAEGFARLLLGDGGGGE